MNAQAGPHDCGSSYPGYRSIFGILNFGKNRQIEGLSPRSRIQQLLARVRQPPALVILYLLPHRTVAFKPQISDQIRGDFQTGHFG
jgi:hypothetical protein